MLDAAPTAFQQLLRRHRLAAGLTQEALAERAGLSVHGIQKLEQGVTHPYRDTIQRLVSALRLSDEDARAFRAVAPTARRRQPSPPTSPAGPPWHNLPGPLTSFVGRERELAAVAALVGAARLVTLTGPGGVGKTRLALRAAEELAADFPDGVVFVSLAELDQPAQVLPAMARAFGVREGRRPLGSVLGELLRSRHILLVLDNCEQVVGSAPALGALLAGCPRLTLLATSRAPLQLSAEQVFPVPPLALPSVAAAPEELAQVEAVALFLERARAVAPEFSLTVGNAAAVAGICRALDGLPLALELAAARVRLLPPGALLERMTNRLALLTAGAVDLPARQRTLRATLAWSYDLLGQDERALFRRLGVFVGGCALDLAEAVARGAGSCEIDLLEGLDALVRHSLLRQEEADGEPRCWMLETVREFALERLGAAGEEAATRQAHADSLLRLVEVDPPLRRRERLLVIPLPLSRWERERENLRQALEWYAQQGDAESELRLVTRSFQLWWNVGPLAEGLGWLRRSASWRSGPVPFWRTRWARKPPPPPPWPRRRRWPRRCTTTRRWRRCYGHPARWRWMPASWTRRRRRPRAGWRWPSGAGGLTSKSAR